MRCDNYFLKSEKFLILFVTNNHNGELSIRNHCFFAVRSNLEELPAHKTINVISDTKLL